MNSSLKIYSPNPAVNETIHTLLKLGCPPIPVAPKQNPRDKWCYRIAKTKDGWQYCPIDKELNPIPKFTGKNPSFLDRDGSPRICLHGNYQDRLPTEQELRKFFCHAATGVGTLGGHSEIVWLDFDTKCYPSPEGRDVDVEAIIARGLAGTWIERTGSDGWRIAVKLQQKPNFTNFATDDTGTHRGEALFEGRFTVLAPSIHPNGKSYRRVGFGDPIEVESLEAIGILPAKEEVEQKKRKVVQEKKKQEIPNYGKPSKPTDNPWDIRNFGQYFEGYTERDGWGYAQCPHHLGASSFTSFRVNLTTGQYKLWCNCDPKDVWKSGLELAISRGHQVPDRTILPDEWQYKFGLPDWFKGQLHRLSRVFKGFGKLPSISALKTQTPQPKPQPTIYYTPGKLPTRENYPKIGSPKILFAPGQRLQVLGELVDLGYHDILDSSPTGTSKSHETGLADPSSLGVDRLWNFSEDHRNPTTAPAEANYVDMPVRNPGMVEDDSRRTALNNLYVRWPRPDEKATTAGNCFRTPLFHELAAKGYHAEIEAEAKTNPVCGSCHMAASCAGQGGMTPIPGASFRSDRREAFFSSRIRSSINSAPNPKDLEAKVGTSEDGDAGETETNRNAAFLDEAMRQLKPTDAIEVDLADFDQMLGEIASKLPDVYEALKPLLALRPVLAGEVALTKETYHGLNDAAVRSALNELKEKLFAANESSNLIIPEIIEKIKSIQPNLREILTEPDGFNKKDGVSAKDRGGISNSISKLIRQHVRQESYRDIAKELRSLPTNWLIPFLEVWNGSQRGALRINNGVLTVTTRNTRHAEICKVMKWVCYLDATATREYLALHLDIEPTDIVQIEQETAKVENLTIIQVTDLGLVGHGRSDSLKKRLEALKPALKGRHADIAFLEHKGHAQADEGDGWWFNHNRGSNEYKTRSAIASFGAPYQNIGSLQDLWLTLTGDRNVDKDAPGFSEFVEWQTQSEVAQAVGRLRANLRGDETLTYYSCSDFDLGFLENYYPGATIKQEAAFNITPQAGTVGQQTRWALVEAARHLVEAGQKITQSAIAKAANVTQGRISQIASEMGGWRVLKKLLASLLDSLYRTANNFEPLDEEQKFLAKTYLPLVAEEDPSDVIPALVITVQDYGWKVFEAILAATSLKTRGRLLAVVISGLPPGLHQEFKAIAAQLVAPMSTS